MTDWMSGLHKFLNVMRIGKLFFAFLLHFLWAYKFIYSKTSQSEFPKLFSHSRHGVKFFSLTASRNTFIICTTTTVSCSDRELWKIPWEAWCVTYCHVKILFLLWNHHSLLSPFLFWGITPTMNFLEALNWEMLSWKILPAISHRNDRVMTRCCCDAFMSSSEHDVSIFSDGISNFKSLDIDGKKWKMF